MIWRILDVASGGLAFVPVRHLAQWPPVLEYLLWPPSAPVVFNVAPPPPTPEVSLVAYMSDVGPNMWRCRQIWRSLKPGNAAL
jgi:hypothetical protein